MEPATREPAGFFDLSTARTGALELLMRIHSDGDVLMEKWLSKREPLLTTAVVAKWLGIAPRTVCLWAECKEIPAIKIGRQWRFRESELWEWLRNPGAAKMKYHLANRPTAAAV